MFMLVFSQLLAPEQLEREEEEFLINASLVEIVVQILARQYRKLKEPRITYLNS
jgi:uncharacterized protein YybS (DUF2232 family)